MAWKNLALSGACLAAMTASGFAADHPGQQFHLTVSQLPKPYATAAVDNHNKIIPRPDGKLPEAPAGFKVNVFADHLSNARWLAVAPNGDVFLSEPTANKITVLRDSDGDGKADKTFTYFTGMHHLHGMAFHDGYFYVSDQEAAWRFAYHNGDTAAPGKPERITVAPDLRETSMHPTRDMAFAPDGTLFIEMGSRDNLSEFQPGAKIFKVDAKGALVEYASGTRNPVGIAFRPGTDTLYVATDERDGLGDALPPDYFTSIKPGGFYGYPYAYIGNHPDPDLGTKRPDLVAKAIVPDVLFPAHSAPTGLAFYTGASFPAAYKNDAFVSLHGSWNTSIPTGYKVVRMHFVNGKPTGGYENFLTGFWDGVGGNGKPAEVWGRPVGLAVAKDGALLVADDQGNTIWRVQATGKK